MIQFRDYLSYSKLTDMSKCRRLAFYKNNRKLYAPAFRAGAKVKGAAVHKAIQTLHTDPQFSPALIFQQELDYIESEEVIPIDWGKKGRDYQMKDGIGTVEAYWRWNAGINILSSERWFYRAIPMPDGTTEWIRGRFDQLLNIDGKLVLRELKTGKAPDPKALERDMQCAIQADAILNGFVVIGDEGYVSSSDENYHIHDFKTEDNKVWKCERCNLEAERLNILPYQIILYHIPSLVPYAGDIKKGITVPRADPEYTMYPSEMNLPLVVSNLQRLIMEYRTCESTGIWSETGWTGFMSPCPRCEYAQHCKDGMLCKVHTTRGDDNGDE